MKATVLFEALVILRAFKEMPTMAYPEQVVPWRRLMAVHNELEVALIYEGLRVPVEQPQEAGA